MTCFWDSLIRSIQNEDFKKIFNIDNNPSPKIFVEILKKNNRICNNVLWNNVEVGSQFLKEIKEAIDEYNICNITNGYDCSSCDPFLFLICEIFEINIKQNFNGANIEYLYKNNAKYTIQIKNDRGHCWT